MMKNDNETREKMSFYYNIILRLCIKEKRKRKRDLILRMYDEKKKVYD